MIEALVESGFLRFWLAACCARCLGMAIRRVSKSKL